MQHQNVWIECKYGRNHNRENYKARINPYFGKRECKVELKFPILFRTNPWINELLFGAMDLDRVLLLSVVVVIGCQQKSSSTDHLASSLSRPNIILIMADDLGYSDIGPYGQKKIKTPFLDQMAREGMTFTQHYAGNTVCAPSRCALMTGMHMGHAEVRGNKQDTPHGQIPISEQAVTVAELLQDAGYATGLIGKWGLGTEHTAASHWPKVLISTMVILIKSWHTITIRIFVAGWKKEYLRNEVVYQDTAKWHRGLAAIRLRKLTILMISSWKRP